MARVKTWVWLLLAATGILVILFVALVGGSAYWIYQHTQITDASSESAAEEFGRERARFAGQQPLLELRAGSDPIVHRTAERSSDPITSLHVLSFDPDEDKLIRVTVPFWIVRLAPGKSFSMTSNDSRILGRVRVTTADIEHRGRGLILDATDVPARGVRALVWTD